MPPEYDDDDEIDYALDDKHMSNEILNDMGIRDCDSVEKVLNQPEMTHKKTNTFLNKIINDAEKRRKQLSGFKSHLTKQYKKGIISEAERQMGNKRIDDARATLNEYIAYFK